MAVEWDGLIGGLEYDFHMLAEEEEKQLNVLDRQIADWAKGYGEGREVERLQQNAICRIQLSAGSATKATYFWLLTRVWLTV